MAACADDPRQVVAIVEAAGIERRACVAQQQRARATLGLRLRDRLVEIGGSFGAQSDVAMRVDQTGQDPAAGPVRTEDGVRACHRFGAQDAIDDPPIDRFTIG